MKPLFRLLALVLVALASCAFAQAPEKPRVYALVSAMGGEITVVRQARFVSGTLDNARRYSVPVPGADVDVAVLRGLDRAVASEDPDSTRVFLRLSSDAVRGVAGYQRGQTLSGKAIAALEQHPDRKDWDRIVLVAPRFLNPERDGMGSKLHGIGLYIHAIGRGGHLDPLGEGIDTTLGYETTSPSGKKDRSDKFVAPYFYAQVWVIDAKTMKVIETNERYDFQRLYDKDSLALDAAQTIPVDVLSGMMEKFVERAAARTLNDRQGEVIIREPRIVK